ncbi:MULTISPECIES: type II toxin-antitoxin system VapC family toxin [unclassified Mannheimia]|uniref:type II toxin-antitoxin system VapC family toxin n=1 Tax=unclassified Mannheimia TaxID=2645054 RepID=UPI00359D36ED
MTFLLDTNAVIAILNGNNQFITTMKQYKPSDFAVSSIVMFELFYGAYKSQNIEKNLAKIALLPFEVLVFNEQDAQQAGEIRAKLAKQGTPIGTYDVQIAGQAIAQNLTLITHNVKEFQRVPNLRYEDWQR